MKTEKSRCFKITSSLTLNSACECPIPNQVCVSGQCVCDIGYTPDSYGNCQPAVGRYHNLVLQNQTLLLKSE